MDHEKNYVNNTVTRKNYLKMNQEINIKKEVDILDTDMPKGSVCYCIDFQNEIRIDAVTCGRDFELDNNNTELKEQPFVSDNVFQKEEKCFFSDLVKKIKKEFVTYNENGEVKVLTISTESQCESETLVSDIPQQSENMDVKTEESAHSSRLSVYAGCPQAPKVEAIHPSEIPKDGYSHRGMKEFDSGKTCISVSYSESEILIKPTRIGGEPSENIFPGKSVSTLPDVINEEAILQNTQVYQKCFIQKETAKGRKLTRECKKPHKCNICKKRFTHLGTLKTHSLIHQGTRPHKCNICNKRFTQLGTLKRHSLIHEGKKPHKCNVCNKSFTQLGALKRHSLIHEGIKPHNCNFCNKRFTRLEHLKTHSLIHECTRPHKCNICNNSFTELTYLKSHSLSHVGLKPYKCNVCNKFFTQLGHLKRHSVIHEGLKPYTCNVCNKSYNQRETLKRHSLIHEGKKPYKCYICNKSFTEQRNLKRHSLIHLAKMLH